MMPPEKPLIKRQGLLGLGYPGGPAISKKADEYLKKEGQSLTMFPRPMIGSNNYDFSFSGLKTSFNYTVKSKKVAKENVPKLAAEIQEAIVDVLVTKSIRALKRIQTKVIPSLWRSCCKCPSKRKV